MAEVAAESSEAYSSEAEADPFDSWPREDEQLEAEFVEEEAEAADATGAALAAEAPDIEGEAEQPAAWVLWKAAVCGWSVEQVGRWLRDEVEAAVATGLADPALIALFAEQEIDCSSCGRRTSATPSA